MMFSAGVFQPVNPFSDPDTCHLLIPSFYQYSSLLSYILTICQVQVGAPGSHQENA